MSRRKITVKEQQGSIASSIRAWSIDDLVIHVVLIVRVDMFSFDVNRYMRIYLSSYTVISFYPLSPYFTYMEKDKRQEEGSTQKDIISHQNHIYKETRS